MGEGKGREEGKDKGERVWDGGRKGERGFKRGRSRRRKRMGNLRMIEQVMHPRNM